MNNSLKVIRGQNIQGVTLKFGDLIEKEINQRKTAITDPSIIPTIQRHIAQTSIGASALRNQGAKGLIKISREFCEHKIKLHEFQKNLRSGRHRDYLNTSTERLLKEFPDDGKSWGAARKAVNLFFRNVIYNYYLRSYLQITNDSEKYLKDLEVPLDRDVALG